MELPGWEATLEDELAAGSAGGCLVQDAGGAACSS